MGYSFIFKRGVGWMSQAFRSGKGSPWNPPGGHTGEDWAVPAGTPVYSPCDGYIRNSGWLSDNYMANPWWLTRYGGDTLVVDAVDANGRTETMPTFVIAHLQDSTAPVGKRVRKGELIGLSGNSGTATTGPHAHIEVLPPNWDFNNGVYGRVNPRDYFTEYQDGVQAQSTPIKQTPKGLFVTLKPEQEVLVFDRNKKYIDAPISLVDEKVWQTPIRRGGKEISALQELADCKTLLIALQGQLAGVVQALGQIAKASGTPVDLEAVTKAAEAGAANALSGLSVTIQQGAKPGEAA